ncbi:uncharacterized protein LOC128422191 isoform X2 [Podarcis raffonei]|uniref:uncharacterized protein LOC128422191 isoform X2 n=1 Tax=Podarcis raffonei TaxID=65483 RepID=UPI0023294614|nr:uncharacterized protein LOC128422191 isoform X2 [Podarcis raffonei]
MKQYFSPFICCAPLQLDRQLNAWRTQILLDSPARPSLSWTTFPSSLRSERETGRQVPTPLYIFAPRFALPPHAKKREGGNTSHFPAFLEARALKRVPVCPRGLIDRRRLFLGGRSREGREHRPPSPPPATPLRCRSVLVQDGAGRLCDGPGLRVTWTELEETYWQQQT